MSDIFAICKVVQQQIILNRALFLIHTTGFQNPPTILRISRELTFDSLDYSQDLACLPHLAAAGAGHARGGRGLTGQLLRGECLTDRDSFRGQGLHRGKTFAQFNKSPIKFLDRDQ